MKDNGWNRTDFTAAFRERGTATRNEALPVAIQLLEVAKVKSGSAEPNRKKVAELTWEQIRTIAQDKMVGIPQPSKLFAVRF